MMVDVKTTRELERTFGKVPVSDEDKLEYMEKFEFILVVLLSRCNIPIEDL